MQKYVGPKFVIPSRFKDKPFNYYISEEKLIKENLSQKECSICLEPLRHVVLDNVKCENSSQSYNLNNNTTTNNSNIENSKSSLKSDDDIMLNLNNKKITNLLKNKSNIKELSKFKMQAIIINISHSAIKITNLIKNKIVNIINSLKYQYNLTEYMITPCNHVFHRECMEIWIEKKLECPYCRSLLPVIY